MYPLDDSGRTARLQLKAVLHTRRCGKPAVAFPSHLHDLVTLRYQVVEHLQGNVCIPKGRPTVATEKYVHAGNSSAWRPYRDFSEARSLSYGNAGTIDLERVHRGAWGAGV